MRARPNAEAAAPRTLGNDIGRELVFDVSDTVAQLQFLFFQSLQLEHVRTRRILQCGNGGIEVAMCLDHAAKLSPQLVFFLLGHRRVVGPLALCRNSRAIGTRRPVIGYMNR